MTWTRLSFIEVAEESHCFLAKDRDYEVYEKEISKLRMANYFGVAFCGDTDATPHPGTSRVCLNSDTMFDAPDPKEEMWQTMVHELVHAYLQVACGRLRAHPLDVPGGYRIGHGFVFRFIINLIYHRVDKDLGKPIEDILYRYGPRTIDSLPSFVTNILGSLFDIELLEEKRADTGKAAESEATTAESTEKSTELTMKDTDAKDKGTKPEGKRAEPNTMGREPKDKDPVDAGSKAEKSKMPKDKSTKSSGKTADGPKTKAYSSSE
ncbi:hypothetical protein OEA41_008299 [Lepraria neglecta]|uniref:SprT-like domain-containing protein n=1 Tax=Lepraria neglecta TaxID=209136 RepID=A0AAD9ZED7_9LECA|nr:hypothetical protein OEA41_008299 [Lepraria neglecta]